MWVPEKVSQCVERVAGTTGRGPVIELSHDPVPVNKEDAPFMMELLHDHRGFYYIVRWAKPVLFYNGERKTSLWFSVGRYGS